MIGHNFVFSLDSFQFPSVLQVTLGFLAGIVIGVFSSMLGVAGGELIIPTIVLLFSIDIKLAGSLSLAISIPTILMGLFKYRRQGKLDGIGLERELLLSMSLGSIVGAFIGSILLGFVSSEMLYLILGGILLLSALKLSRHNPAPRLGP